MKIDLAAPVRVLASPRSRRQDYYVYGEALNSTSYNNSQAEDSSSAGSVSGDYVMSGGDTLEGIYYVSGEDEGALCFDQDASINFIDGEEKVLGSMQFDGTDSLTFKSLHLVPQTDNQYDLGTKTQRWRNLYLGGAIVSDNKYWGQKVGDDGHVKGALTDADGMLPSQTESYDLGSPTRRYSDYYGRRIFLGENNYSAVDNGVRGLTLAGHQNSIYAFGKADPKREEGRQGFVLTSTWEGNGGSAGLVNGAETYWMMYRKLYVGERDGKGFYDSQAAILDSKNYTIYGARIGCNALLATTVDSENIVCNNLEVKSNLVTPSSSETSDRRLKNKIRKIEKVDP